VGEHATFANPFELSKTLAICQRPTYPAQQHHDAFATVLPANRKDTAIGVHAAARRKGNGELAILKGGFVLAEKPILPQHAPFGFAMGVSSEPDGVTLHRAPLPSDRAFYAREHLVLGV
jgi:hypothetical protein